MAATSASEKDEVVAQFIGVTGTDKDRAQFFLESAGWQLQVALESFYDEADDIADVVPPQVAALPPSIDPPTGPQAGVPSVGPSPATAGVGASKGTTPRSGNSSGRVATLSDYTAEKRGDSDEEGQAFYAGGADHGSGQQVVGPKKKKKEGADGLVTDIFKHAKEHGAEEVGSGAPSTSHRKPTSYAFKGAGYRLGETPTEPVMPVPGTSGTMPGPRPKERHVILKMWKTGFSIDDGELRDYRSPENDVFLKSIMKGEIPDELLQLGKGGEVSLDLEDHRNEDYVKPKSTMKAFTGHGYMLGSPTPAVVYGGSSQTQESSNSSGTSATAPSVVDSSQPVTTVQLRLADGTRLPAKFNHTHTVGDIRNYIIASRPQYSDTPFNLMTTFPNKALADDSQTILDAKLMNAVVVQRMT